MQTITAYLQWFVPAWRWFLAAIFIWSGGSKLIAPADFAVVMDALGLVPSELSLPAAVLLAAGEVLLGLGLVFGVRGTMRAATALLIFFILVLAHGIGLGLDIDCGCFGSRSPEKTAFQGLRPALYRDLLLLALTIGALWLQWLRAAGAGSKPKLSAKGTTNPAGYKEEQKC